MHNLFILSSPRKNGNSETMAKAVATGITENSDDTCDFVNVNRLSITPCVACGSCSDSGSCIIKDDMEGLYERTDLADRIFWVSPVYFYALTAQIKTYIDRNQAIWARKYLLGIRHRAAESRSGHLLSCAATDGARLFTGPELSIQCLCDTLDLHYGPSLLLRNLEGKDALQKLPEIMDGCESFGRTLVTK